MPNPPDHYAQYGYSFLPTEECYGVDISHQHMDDLDNLSLKEVYERATAGKNTNVVDLGGGFGAHSIRMAKVGATVTMFDRSDMASANFITAVREASISPEALNFIQKDFTSIVAEDLPDSIDVLYSQRAIHYVPYTEAKRVLSLFFERMAAGGVVYISAAGCETESGKTHPDRDRPVEERYNFYAEEMQKKHGITHQTVVYAETDLKHLLEEVGFAPSRVYQSSFGNVKAIAHKPS